MDEITTDLNQPEIEEEATGFDAGDLGDEQPEEGADGGFDTEGGEGDFDVAQAVRDIQSRFDGLDGNAIRAALGRLSSFQSTLDRLQGQLGNSSATEQKLNQLEEDISTLMEVLSGESLLDEEQRARVSGRRQARTQASEREALLRELEERVKPPAPTIPPEWQRAQDRTLAYAEAKGLSREDAAQLPWGDAQGTGDPEAAYQYLKRAIDAFQAGDADDDGATARVAQRRQAAGRGTPQRTSAASAEDIIARYAAGDPNVSEAEYERAMKAAGYR